MSDEPTDNVIAFPKEYKAPPENHTTRMLQQSINAIDNIQQLNQDQITRFLMETMIKHLAIAKYDFYIGEDDYYARDLALVTEAIRSLLYKFHGLDHPLQFLVERIFHVADTGQAEFTTGPNDNPGP